MKVAFGIIIGFVLGLSLNWLWPKTTSIQEHWRALRSYDEFVREASNYRPDPLTGFSSATPPDILPDLSALVAAGELRHADLVFPTIPVSREVDRQWMIFAQQHPQIIYIDGNPSYTNLRTKGVQPLHFVWFRRADEHVVQSLVRQLEAGAQKDGEGEGGGRGSHRLRSKGK